MIHIKPSPKKQIFYDPAPDVNNKLINIQRYLFRCYELERMYIYKHKEFIFMKNVLNKLYIYYVIIFIIFHFYIKTLTNKSPTAGKDCSDRLDKLNIPIRYIKDYNEFVNQQKNLVENIQTEVLDSELLKNTEPPNLQGGSYQSNLGEDVSYQRGGANNITKYVLDGSTKGKIKK